MAEDRPDVLIYSPYGRGRCSVCKRDMNLRKDGTVRPHGPNSRRCKGTHHLPQKGRA